jgi:hypothetical protein
MKHNRNPYFNEYGQPELRQSVVAFVDILGYKEMVLEAENIGKPHEFLLTMRNALIESLKHLTEEENDLFDKDFKVKIFTDNIVIGYPVKYSDAESELGSIFNNLSFFQLSMVNHGFFLRGAISIDNLFIDDNIVFGKGLIDSYLAENKKARDPRIILTETASLAVKHHLTYYAQPQYAPQTRDLFLDSDGQYFLNYLDSVLIGVPEREPYFNAIMKHKQVIEEKLQEFRNRPLLWSKYAWSANYHNFFCDLHDYFSEKHKVDLSKYQMQPQLII